MKIQIRHRYTDAVLFEAEAVSVKVAVEKAISEKANLSSAYLSDANLSGADLSGAYLSGAYLSGAYLSGADLSGANLSGADLSGADLRGANLRGANLRGAYLSGAYLSGADLSDAYLRGANLSGANLRGANLRGANLSVANLSVAYLSGADLSGAKNISEARGIDAFKHDIWAILLAAPREVNGLLEALRNGKVNGSAYEGECACLVGTIANVRQCNYSEIPNIIPNGNRPAERWFVGINTGDTPETSEISRLTVSWVEEWQKLFNAAVEASK